MTKETVRYPDGVVAAVEDAVDQGVFESKSEFYRFAAEYVLRALDPEYEPETFDFHEILDELEAEGELAGTGADAGAEEPAPFLEAVSAVRRHCFRGEYERAEAVIDRRYGAADPEAILLEEFLAQYKVAAATGLHASSGAGPNAG
ncbi:MAG: CopG family transcriptional regulator [Halobacteriaceae archaeon]